MVNLYTENWHIDNVETVLFDKDGTFIDSHVYWGRIIVLRIKAVMKFYNIEEKYFNDLCFSLGYDTKTSTLIEQGPIALLARDAVISALTDKLKIIGIKANSEKIKDIFQNVHKEFLNEIYDYIKPIKEAQILFERLKRKSVKMAVVTSDTKANTEAILNHLNLSHYFDFVLGKDNCSKAKKTGEPALIALKELNANKETTIAIGDAPMDFEMSKNAGLKGTILVSTGQIPESSLKKFVNSTVPSLDKVLVQ